MTVHKILDHISVIGSHKYNKFLVSYFILFVKTWLFCDCFASLTIWYKSECQIDFGRIFWSNQLELFLISQYCLDFQLGQCVKICCVVVQLIIRQTLSLDILLKLERLCISSILQFWSKWFWNLKRGIARSLRSFNCCKKNQNFLFFCFVS